MASTTIALRALRSDVIFSERRSADERRFVAKDPRSGRFFHVGEVEHFIGH